MLRAKQCLQNTEWSNVYLRSSKSQIERPRDVNTRTLVRIIIGGENMRLTGSGRLVHKEELGRYPGHRAINHHQMELEDSTYIATKHAN